MSTALLKLQRLQKKASVNNFKVLSFVKIPSIPWATLFWVGLALTITLSLTYIFQIKQLTDKYYFSGVYEQKIEKLSQESKNLQLSLAENVFISHILAQAKTMDLQSYNSVKYIQITENMIGAIIP